VTDLHAQIDLIEGELHEALPGAVTGPSKRAFMVLRLMRNDGTTGVGEAAPLPGYSADSMQDVTEELCRLAERPVSVDALAEPREVLSEAFSAFPLHHPASRFALETALLDWLGKTRGQPLHRLLAGSGDRSAVPIADLVPASIPAEWPRQARTLVEEGATHLKFKVGTDLAEELSALRAIRRDHPLLHLRVDGNRRIRPELLVEHATALEGLELELFEEPVRPEHWTEVLDLPLPFALDETLRDRPLSESLLRSQRIRAVVLKPTVLGGFTGSLEAAELAGEQGVPALVSHTFDGPISRAAAAELALALGNDLAAGLGRHPALDLWPSHRIAAISGRRIVPHDVPGLGLELDEVADA
jgi:L-alanine-DL-glutamate epimerase-like enolase superfamily enzyme